MTENGNTLKYRVEQVESKLDKYMDDQKELYKDSVQPFLDKTNEAVNFINDNKKLIKELKLMQADINWIKTARKEDRKHRRQLTYLVVGTLLSGILIPIIMKYL